MVEIERKFLVKSDGYKSEAYKKARLVQGYLNSDPERTVRIRVNGEKAFITIKGKSNESGISRFEWEKEIPLNEAEKLLKLCEPGIIEKVRFLVKNGKHVFEVDEFQKENSGLVIAEIELNSEEESFDIPEWLGEDVTGDNRYYNSQLSKNPYKNW